MKPPRKAGGVGRKHTGVGKSKAKSKSAPKTVDEYLARIPEPAHATLQKVRATIRSVVPSEAAEVLSYGIPAFRSAGAVVVWYAAFADHCSLFPTASAIAKFKDELKSFRVSKGTIQFPVHKPLPAALLRKIIKARLAAISSR